MLLSYWLVQPYRIYVLVSVLIVCVSTYTQVDPVDSVQTIENFFDFAFLIKDKKVRVTSTDRNQHTPHIELLKEDVETANTLTKDKKQQVLTLSISDVKRISQLLTRLNGGDGSNSHNNSSYTPSSPVSSKSPASTAAPHTGVNPLHRSDVLYTCSNAHEQSTLLEEMKMRQIEHSKRLVVNTNKDDSTLYSSPVRGKGTVVAGVAGGAGGAGKKRRIRAGEEEEEEEEVYSPVPTKKRR